MIEVDRRTLSEEKKLVVISTKDYCPLLIGIMDLVHRKSLIYNKQCHWIGITKKPNVGQDYWDRHSLVTVKPELLGLIT